MVQTNKRTKDLKVLLISGEMVFVVNWCKNFDAATSRFVAK